MQTSHHIIIIGGGAGGLELATHLGHKLRKKPQITVKLVDKSFTHLWKPLLHEVAAGTLNSNEDEINYTAHAFTHHYHFCYGEMTGLNREKKEIILAPVLNENNHTKIIPQRTLSYDTLVIAIGSKANDFNTPGVRENCIFIDERVQADQFHQQFLRTLMQAQNQLNPLSEEQLGIAIVGGGATGVELAAELHYAIQQAAKYGFSSQNLANKMQITLVEAADRILAALPERVSDGVAKELENLGIKIYCNKRVTEVTASGLKTQDGLFIPAQLKVWAAGIKAPDFLQNLDNLETNRINQLVVKTNLVTTRDENIFAFGDCASCPQLNTDKPVPPRAQAAHQQASLLAESLVRKLNGKSLLDYRYHDYGSLISLSQHTTIGNLMGRLMGSVWLEGKLARLFYVSLYKLHQFALFGFWRGAMLTLANLLSSRVKPRLKLH